MSIVVRFHPDNAHEGEVRRPPHGGGWNLAVPAGLEFQAAFEPEDGLRVSDHLWFARTVEAYGETLNAHPR